MQFPSVLKAFVFLVDTVWKATADPPMTGAAISEDPLKSGAC